MRRGILSAAIILPFILACGDDGPAGVDNEDEDTNGSLVEATGMRFRAAGTGAIEVASADTIFQSDGGTLTSTGTVGTGLSSWIWDHTVQENGDADSVVVHYEVLEGSVDFEKITGSYDPEGEFASDQWSDIEAVRSENLGVGETVRFVLRRP